MDEDLKWLKTLGARELTPGEVERVFSLIEDRQLVTSMFCSGMICGYGMRVFTQPPYPGAPPQEVLALTEEHLPKATWRKNPIPGVGRDDAWEAFSRFTHSEQNRAWLKFFRMPEPRPRRGYDY